MSATETRPVAAPAKLSEPAAERLEFADIQGDILRAYGNDYDCTSYAFVKIECPPAQARAWFSGLLDPDVPTPAAGGASF